MGKYSEGAISVFKYILGGFMVIAGLQTMFAPITIVGDALGAFFLNRLLLVLFGLIFASCGVTLLYGKIRRSRRWTGRGLMGIYLCFVFGTIINIATNGFLPATWVGNFVLSLITGALWLRWKFKTEYINPLHFVDEVVELKKAGHDRF